MEESGDVRSAIGELQMNLARKKSDLKILEHKVKEAQETLDQIIEPKLRQTIEENECLNRQVSELESLAKSKEKYRSKVMEEHSFSLSKLNVIDKQLEDMNTRIQDMKIEELCDDVFEDPPNKDTADLKGDEKEAFQPKKDSIDTEDVIL